MLDSIADFFYLSWHLIRSLFKSRESLERENAEMRRQIAALKAEIEQPRLMTKTKAKSEPTYLLDCVLPPTDVIADGFLAKHNHSHGTHCDDHGPLKTAA
jgi:hypothetical protein